MRTLLILGTTLALLTPVSQPALADDKPPRGRKPLSEIIANLEKRGYLPAEIEYEDGFWEVEAYRSGTEFKFLINAQSGRIVSREADD